MVGRDAGTETPAGGAPKLPHETARVAAGLWQAAEAIRLLIEEAERLRLPAPTVVNQRLTFPAVRGLAMHTQRYAEHLAQQIEQQASGLVVASPDDARRLLASMPPPGQEPPDDR